MVDIIGAGFGRTGTASVKLALELLGFGPCHHMSEVLKRPGTTVGWTAALNGDVTRLPGLLSGYRATLDFPGCLLWREMMAAYPRAKVLLTVRDAKKWYDSARETILNPNRSDSINRELAELLTPFSAAMAARGFRRGLTEAEAIAFFHRHNQSVRDAVPAGKLLVYEVTQGWEPLCAFLGVNAPDTPFPRVNEAGSFRRNVDRVLGTRVDDSE